MLQIEIGDLVTRKSYNNDINFILVDIRENYAILIGAEYRLIADSPLNDLDYAQIRDDNSVNESFDKETRGNLFSNWYKPQTVIRSESSDSSGTTTILSSTKCGIVLHIDGDPFYLDRCLAQYEKLGVTAVGVSIKENKQPSAILDLLKQHKPNILVITGHDSLKKNANNIMDINDYKNSKYFVESVKISREYNPNYDELIIIAGGCKSHYEALMQAGANFASSPDRILINITDPVLVASKFASTSIKNYLESDTIAKELLSGFGGIGGIETRGQCREVKPIF